MAISEGDLAPDFALIEAKGQKVSLADYDGRDVIIFFYPKDDTPGCTKEACAFRDLWREIESLGAVVLGISPDTATSHARFAAKHSLTFPLLADPMKHVIQRYGAWGEKVSYGKKTTGLIRSTVWVDPEGVIHKIWPRVANPAEHPAEVLEALRADREARTHGEA
jgi:peroxiredoxin Q/BCP